MYSTLTIVILFGATICQALPINYGTQPNNGTFGNPASIGPSFVNASSLEYAAIPSSGAGAVPVSPFSNTEVPVVPEVSDVAPGVLAASEVPTASGVPVAPEISDAGPEVSDAAPEDSDIVPGIPAASGVPAASEVPVTPEGSDAAPEDYDVAPGAPAASEVPGVPAVTENVTPAEGIPAGTVDAPSNIYVNASGFEPNVLSVRNGGIVSFTVSNGTVIRQGPNPTSCAPLVGAAVSTLPTGESIISYTVPQNASSDIFFYKVDGERCSSTDKSATLHIASDANNVVLGENSTIAAVSNSTTGLNYAQINNSNVTSTLAAVGNSTTDATRPPFTISGATSTIPVLVLVGFVTFFGTLRHV